jgi:Nickel responsive protein SCO4226-like
VPLYMDIHKNVDGATAEAVAQAHERDLATQGQYGVSYEKYWLDESSGTIFCLVEAPSKEAAERVHREAHGLVADEIHEVNEAN